MSKKYQAISDFMRSPFGRTDSMDQNIKYEKMYNEYTKSNKIYVSGYTIIESSYYIHIKIPSESQKDGKYEYDVIIRFFTDKPELEKSMSLRAYYMQFFSNSPSFIYKYAALYKKEDYLIKELYDKLDPEYKDVMPEKTNSDMILSYDKSIYFACRFLSDGRFRYLNKYGILLQKKKTPEKFFADITDFRTLKFDQELLNTEKKLKKEIEKKNTAEKNKTKKKLSDIHRVSASKTTSKNGGLSNKRVVKITGGHNVKKKVARKSTTKKG